MLKPETTELAWRFGAVGYGAYSVDGEPRPVTGFRFPCYLHPTKLPREDYPGTPSRGCTVILTDAYVYHLHDDTGEVAHREDAEHFRWRAGRWLQPWRTLWQVAVDAEQELARPWVWDTLIKAGTVTLFAGPPKLGKSTLLFDFLAAMSRNHQSFLGLNLSPANVLYVTEEGEVPLGMKAGVDRWQVILGRLHITFLTSDEAGVDWLELLTQVKAFVDESEDAPGFIPGVPPLVVVDTLGFFMTGVDDENDAAKVRDSLRLLVNMVRDKNFACLLVHHTSKGKTNDARWVEKVRGSTAFAGNVDTIAALSGPSDGSVRWLNRVGRCFDNVPSLALQYDIENGYQIRVREKTDKEIEQQAKAEARHEEKLEIVREFLVENPDAGKRKVAQGTGIPEGSVGLLLRQIRNGG